MQFYLMYLLDFLVFYIKKKNSYQTIKKIFSVKIIYINFVFIKYPFRVKVFGENSKTFTLNFYFFHKNAKTFTLKALLP